MKRERKIKILSTLGPASSTEEMIEKLFRAGADVFRINMSHASHDTMRNLVKIIRNVEKKCGRPIGILADLQGPKLRVGTFKNTKEELKIGQTFTLDDKDVPGDNSRVYLPHPEILQSVKVGERLYVDDGKLQLMIEKCDGHSIVTKVIAGSYISDRKGVSLPDTELKVTAMTPKDHDDLRAVLTQEIDWVALSFVQRPEDILEARKIIGDKMAIIAKIEKPQAVKRIREIVKVVDAIMVARGDLGVECPLEDVPGIQLDLVNLCRREGKPVVVATQMLESMINSPMPTRAEVSDVANAIFQGADAIMLSAESAAGKYPETAVATMDKIARKVERDSNYPRIIHAGQAEPESTEGDAISLAAREISDTMELPAIVAFTRSGSTGLRISRERPAARILALSPLVETARRLAPVWGIHSVVTEDVDSVDEMASRACDVAHSEGFAHEGKKVIITAGMPFGCSGTTNMLRIATVGANNAKKHK